MRSTSLLLALVLMLVSLLRAGRADEIVLPITDTLSLESLGHGGGRKLQGTEPLLNVFIDGCKIYDDNDVCRACRRDYYLSRNQCVPVPETRLIERCNAYSSDLSCFECEAGFAYLSGKCVRPSANPGNCEVFSSTGSCKLCPSDSRLVNGACRSVPNCSTLSNGLCTSCLEGYHLQVVDLVINCVRLPPGSAIENCRRYSQNFACDACEPSFVLSVDGYSCLKPAALDGESDPKCEEQLENAGTVCGICKPGFYMNQGRCLSCGVENCLICDPSSPNRCLLCKSQYFMIGEDGSRCASSTEDLSNLLPGTDTKHTGRLQASLLLLGILSLSF